MQVSSTDTAPALSRGDGLVSRLLHSERDDPETDPTVTRVRVEPGASQVHHSHDPEQVYVIVAGEGEMTVGDERLEYVSAATPAFPREEVEAFYEE
ncbi:MAG: hypothetical protein BRD23_04975 [Halobacteriales archaeon SW_9_67_25]|jgi:mannose-6-phosphate isomerase-like protein (cupin superfamily)|nr:MAG: hypothetical protein BRD23_04975 [Halobacteriales archaeon SW_9_67_25]